MVIAESDWHCDKQSMKCGLGEKSNRYYHKLRPQSVSTKCRLQDCRPGEKLQTRYKTQTENKDCFSSDTWQHVIWKHTECHAVAFPRSSFINISIIVGYSLIASSYILSLTKRPDHRSFICCSPDLPADLPIAERPPRCRMRRQRTTRVQRRSCVMSLVLEIVLIWQLAHKLRRYE